MLVRGADWEGRRGESYRGGWEEVGGDECVVQDVIRVELGINDMDLFFDVGSESVSFGM